MIVKVNTDIPYSIVIEKGVISQTGAIMTQIFDTKQKIMIVSDSNVAQLYIPRVQKSLETSGFVVKKFIFAAGESSKNLSTVSEIYKALTDNGFTRKDLIVALGGGVTGDMAGFAAATYLRGIDFVQIPTTLLAQIDSSVGGKTGVDLPEGKNLVGAFHQPRLVICDPNTLKTLPKAYFVDGLGEVVKYACIEDVELFDRLESGLALEDLNDTIFRCIDCKRKFVEEDAKEQGRRILLNFGHTLGHAIEKLHDFSGISHGKAVAIGMKMICEIGEKLSYTKEGTTARVIALLGKLDLPIEDSHSLDKIIDATNLDKKSVGKMLNMIFLKEIGNAFVKQEERNYLVLKFKILAEQKKRNENSGS